MQDEDVIRRLIAQLGLGPELQAGSDAGVLSAVVRVTGGNFRLVERLFAQLGRVAQINDTTTLRPELVTAAEREPDDRRTLARPPNREELQHIIPKVTA